MHTLFQGLVAAVIGALVALLVLMVTVRTQNKGIRQQIAVQQESLRKQLEVQERSVAEQLRVQRYENTRVREHAAGVQFIRGVHGWSELVGANRSLRRRGEDTESMNPRVEAMFSALEELRLNQETNDHEVIDAFSTFVSRLKHTSEAVIDGSRDEFPEEGPYVSTLERFLILRMNQYVKSSADEREAMKKPLRIAWHNQRLNNFEWIKTCIREDWERYNRKRR